MKTNKMMKSALVLLGSAVCLTACMKEEAINEKYRPAGKEIEFGASTNYQNSDDTRTIYSGDILGLTVNRFERIDWEGGDEMTIEYNQATASGTYTVTSVTKNAEKSFAVVESTDEDKKLVWGSETNHVFYAMYPANKSGRNTLVNGKVTGLIPATQTITYNSSKKKYLPDMNYGYMVAYADNNQIDGGRVQLPFTPAMTAFEFRLQRTSTDGAALKLTKVELISASQPLVGTFSFQITGGNARGAVWNKTVGTSGTTLSGTGKTITANFPSGGVTLPAHGGTDYLDFTLFALPVELTGLTLRLTYGDGSTKSLTLKDSDTVSHTFEACKKYIITNSEVPSENWEYVIDNLTGFAKDYQGGAGVLNSTLKSYKVKNGTGVKEKVAFTIQYQDGSTWKDGLPSWLTRTAGDLSGSTTGTNLQITMAAQTNAVQVDANGIILDEHTNTLRARTAKTNYDLSLDDLPRGTRRSLPYTANCYVVDAPGTYKFPLVYGNGLAGTGVNSPAFWGIVYTADGSSYSYRPEAGEGYYLGNYIDHEDNYMGRDPWIANHLSGQSLTSGVLWTDSPGLVRNVNISGTGNNAYMTFEVPKANICQGNALIAVFANGKIAWSWHIWVTDEDLRASAAKATFSGFKYAPVNVGWCDGKVEEDYAGRTCKVRVVQEESGLTREATITQYRRYTTTRGDSPFYQYGRKDPLQPGILRVTYSGSASGDVATSSVENKPYYAPNSRYAPQNGVLAENGVSIGTAIQNPYKHYANGEGSEYTNWTQDERRNFWNAACNTYGEDSWTETVWKSVYDPTPAGYMLPNQAAYAGFTEDNFPWHMGSYTISAGRTYTVNGLIFPATGHRDVFTDELKDIGKESYFWSANAQNALYVRDFDVQVIWGNFRGRGMSVRPVLGLVHGQDY